MTIVVRPASTHDLPALESVERLAARLEQEKVLGLAHRVAICLRCA